MGKTHSKPLAARHGKGTSWEPHGKGMLCVNRPLMMSEHAAFVKLRPVYDDCVLVTAIRL